MKITYGEGVVVGDRVGDCVLLIIWVILKLKVPSQGATWKAVCGLPPWSKLEGHSCFCLDFHSAQNYYSRVSMLHPVWGKNVKSDPFKRSKGYCVLFGNLTFFKIDSDPSPSKRRWSIKNQNSNKKIKK